MPRKIKKPEIKTIQYLDFFDFQRWLQKEHKVDCSDLLADMEAGNDSYAEVWLDTLEHSDSDYAETVQTVLKQDFGIKEKVLFWVCW